MEQILLIDGTAKARQEIQQLEARRKDVAARLEAVRVAINTLTEGKPKQTSPDQVLWLMGMDDPSLLAAVKQMWHRSAGISVPLEMLSDELHRLPADVRALYDAVLAARNQSADPARYWSKDHFAPIPATKEETELILQRNQVFAQDQEAATMYEWLSTYLLFVNRKNARIDATNFSAPDFFDRHPEFIGLVRHREMAGAVGPGLRTEFYVNLDAFAKPRKYRMCFDEKRPGFVLINAPE